MKLLVIGVGVSTVLVFAGVITTWAIIYSAELESTGLNIETILLLVLLFYSRFDVHRIHLVD